MAVVVLGGCASTFNTAENSQYSCPGMPMNVTCKTPSAVYKSTQGELAETEFDKPIAGTRQQANHQVATVMAAGSPMPSMPSPGALIGNHMANSVTADIGVKPVREPARVVRIWIAPWIDKNDNLNLAQYQYTEVKPRTWTVGKPEGRAGGGYIIPRQAVRAASAGTASTQPTPARATNLPAIPESRSFAGPAVTESPRSGASQQDTSNDGLPSGYTPFLSRDAP